jgi:hypothetical protein
MKFIPTIPSKVYSRILRTLFTIAAMQFPFCAGAGEKITQVGNDADSFQKPAWLSELSLSAKEGYDTNVFLSGANQADMPKGAVTLKNRDSFVATISPKVEIDFAPLLGSPKTLQTLSFSYAPDFVIYDKAKSESYDAHRAGATIKAKSGAFTLSLENNFTYIDGSKDGVVYPGGYTSAYATAGVRERRKQIQERTKFSLQFDAGKWFVRPAASLLFYDLMTRFRNISGCQNYVDRYDVNGGLDFGYKITPQFAATLGYRYGHQYQQQLPWEKYSSPNDYQRLLVGIEGKPLPWLKTEIQFGPDFRSYAPDTSTHTTPVTDKNPVKFYGDATLTAELSRNDTLAFKFKEFQWVSSTGRVPYLDTSYDLSYRRKFGEKLRVDLGAKICESDYTGATISSGLRDDFQYTLSAGANYAINSVTSVNASYSVDFGRNGYDDLPASQLPDSKREFTRQIVSVGFQVKY